jgi:uncharacterized phage protein (TIGR01671 family)
MTAKFRAWDKENDQMLFPDDTDKIYFEITTDGIVTYDMRYPGDEYSGLAYLDTIIMQSTGFPDAKGTEIFAGDIAIYTTKSINYGGVYHHNYVEVFQQQNGAYRIRGNNIYGTDAFGNRKCLEVVGNIFENTELLEKESFMTEE